MSGSEFNKLELNNRADLVWPDGEFIDHRIENDNTMAVLYRLDRFFVEVRFEIHSKDILSISALENEGEWDKYLNNIDLGDLLG